MSGEIVMTEKEKVINEINDFFANAFIGANVTIKPLFFRQVEYSDQFELICDIRIIRDGPDWCGLGTLHVPVSEIPALDRKVQNN